MMSTSFLGADSLELSREELELRQWMAAWYHFALTDGHIHPTFELDQEMADRLESYFKVGLSPGEGVGVLFGMLH